MMINSILKTIKIPLSQTISHFAIPHSILMRAKTYPLDQTN